MEKLRGVALPALPCGGAERTETQILPWGKERVAKAQKYVVTGPRSWVQSPDLET